MPLRTPQILNLAQAFDEEWDLQRLTLLAGQLGINLNNIAPDGGVKDRARAFIVHMTSHKPSRERELLETLALEGNARLKAIACELLQPTFVSPTDDPRDAILLGKTAFVNREDLREVVRDFTNPGPYSTRLLIVRGDQPCGKSFTWHFLRHLAHWVGAVPQRLGLENADYTPRELVQQVALLLDLDTSEIPTMADDPQLARIHPLGNWFKGKLPTLRRSYWLVIDDLNDPRIKPETLEAAYALGRCAEEARQDLWVVLLGYNQPIIDASLLSVAQENARFFNASALARHFEHVAAASPMPLSAPRAHEIARLLFSRYPRMDKETMGDLRRHVEAMDQSLVQGRHP